MHELDEQTSFNQKKNSSINRILKKILVFLYSIKNVLSFLKKTFKNIGKSSPVLKLFKKIFAIPVTLVQIISIGLGNHTLTEKITTIFNKTSLKVLKITLWIVKLLFNISKKALIVIALAKYIYSFFRTIYKLSKSVIIRYKERKNEKVNLIILESQIKIEEEKLRFNKDIKIKTLLHHERVENHYRELTAKIQNKEQGFVTKLKKGTHRFIIRGLYLAALTLTLIPVTLAMGAFLFSALSVYECTYGLLNTEQKTESKEIDHGMSTEKFSFKENAVTFFKNIIKHPPKPLIIIASAAIAVALTFLTGPIGAIVFSITLGIITAGILLKKHSEFKKISSSNKNNINEDIEMEVSNPNKNSTAIIQNTLSQKNTIEPSVAKLPTEEHAVVITKSEPKIPSKLSVFQKHITHRSSEEPSIANGTCAEPYQDRDPMPIPSLVKVN